MKKRLLHECILFVRVFLISLIVPLGLRFLKIGVLLDFLDTKKKIVHQNRPSEGSIAKILDATLRYSFFTRHKKCLRRSLLFFHVLRSYGYPAKIHFGIQSKPKGLKGHCWVSLYGRVLFDQERNTEAYTVMLVR